MIPKLAFLGQRNKAVTEQGSKGRHPKCEGSLFNFKVSKNGYLEFMCEDNRLSSEFLGGKEHSSCQMIQLLICNIIVISSSVFLHSPLTT